MGFGIQKNFSDTAFAVRQNLKTFLTHHDFRSVFDTVAIVYPANDNSVTENLTKGFKYLKYYLPDYKTPKIIYLVTGLGNWNAFTVGDDVIGVGLDMALGGRYKNYERVEIPSYISRNLTKENIPVSVFKSVYTGMQPFVMEDQTLLDMMIQKGKEQYFLSKVAPFVPDTLRLGFSKSQTEWCANNEAGIYNFFVQQKLIYEKNWQKVMRYVLDGPTAAGMAQESPGNVGTFLGYNIVKSYMQQHPDVTLAQLIAMTDYQKIFSEAKYKP
jgi:hypothetical protein